MYVNGLRYKYANIKKNLYYFADDYNAESVKLIAGIVDMDKDGFISFSEFQAFEGLLCVPDALYKTAFQLFDTNGNGLVAFGEIDSTFVYLPWKFTTYSELI